LDRVYAALSRVPIFKNVRRESVWIEPLGSLTNSTFKVVMHGEAYALRLPGKDTSDYIDRIAEKHNARAATAAGVNTDIVYFNTRNGTMLSRFVEGSAMTVEQFVLDPSATVRVAHALRKVHRLCPVFQTRFDVFDILGKYRRILRGTPMPVFRDRAVWRGAEGIRRAFEASPAPLAPCHNDPWPGNFVDAGGRLYLIDWEFSGMNDPMWDLADLSVEAELDPEQDRILMEAYHEGPVPEFLYSRLSLHKIMSDLLWSFWAFIQVANDNPRDDFSSYALGRFEKCEARMSSPDFQKDLNAVRGSQRRDVSKHTHPNSPEPRIPVIRESHRDGRRVVNARPLRGS